MAEGRWLADAYDRPPQDVNTVQTGRFIRRWAWWPPLLAAYPAIALDAVWMFWTVLGVVIAGAVVTVFRDN